MTASYPWEALSDALRSHYAKGKYRNMHGVPLSPEELAILLLADLDDAGGWRLVQEDSH